MSIQQVRPRFANVFETIARKNRLNEKLATLDVRAEPNAQSPENRRLAFTPESVALAEKSLFLALLNVNPRLKGLLKKGGRARDSQKRAEIERAILEQPKAPIKQIQSTVARRLNMGDQRPSKKMVSEVRKKMKANGVITR